MEGIMYSDLKIVLNKRLIKAIVKNDGKDIRRLVSLGADINCEFTLDALITDKLLDNNAITIIKNAETSVDKLIKDRFVKRIPVHDSDIVAVKNSSCSKIIVLPILTNTIIITTESKLSPLQLAIMFGWKETIIELIKRGANPNKALEMQGKTILHLLCTAAVLRDKDVYNFDDEIVQLLLDHGADPNIQDILGRTTLFFLERSADFHVNELLRKMLNSSCSEIVSDYRNTKQIERFLINGANPNIKAFNQSCTVLYDIIEHDRYLDEQPNLTNLLLDHGSMYATPEDMLKDPEIIAMMQEDYGQNYGYANAKKAVDEFNSKHKQYVEKNKCLIKAVINKDKSIIDELLTQKTSPNIRDKDGLSILHIAVKLGDCTVIRLLLEKNANPNIKSWKNGTTPLFNAVVSKRYDIAELLLNHAANPNVINTKGLSPLYFSVTDNNTEMTELLLEYKANPDISRQISVLFNVLNGVKKDNDIMIENTLKKIKNMAEFLKVKNIPVNYSLFYQSVDSAEKNDKKSTAKKIMHLLDDLTDLAL